MMTMPSSLHSSLMSLFGRSKCTMRRRSFVFALITFVALPVQIGAPFPPCSPLLRVNKLIESNNWSSDMNPFYPVRPCPYKNPRRAPLHLQYAAFNDPLQNIYHVVTEGTWFFTRGIPRAIRMLLGQERFRVNHRILNEGYNRHFTGRERKQHFGRKTFKRKSYYRK